MRTLGRELQARVQHVSCPAVAISAVSERIVISVSEHFVELED